VRDLDGDGDSDREILSLRNSSGTKPDSLRILLVAVDAVGSAPPAVPDHGRRPPCKYPVAGRNQL